MIRLFFICFFLTASLQAQTEFRSPEIGPDGRVTFRLKAPAAEQVSLRGRMARPPVPLTQNDEGVWSVTIGPLAPDIYSYYFDVDGTRVLDPRNRHTKQWLLMESAFEVVGAGERTFAERSEATGTIHRHTYRSPVRDGEHAAYFVYTPPGYDARGDTRYPVVFLLHGFGDDERAWFDFGRAHVIADNLLAAGRAVPAIVVTPHGHPAPIPFGGRVDWSDYGPRNQDRMEQQVLGEILPRVDRDYLTLPDRDHRAIVGLSMGGGHALGIGSQNLDTFGWIGGFSSGGTAREFDRFLQPLVTHRADPGLTPHLLWIGCGEDDFLIEPNRELTAWLSENQVVHTWVETPGNHSWPVWREYWERFLPLLFR